MDQGDLNSFLDAGKSLQIRGLTNNEADQKSDGREIEKIGGTDAEQLVKVELNKGFRESAVADENNTLVVDAKDNNRDVKGIVHNFFIFGQISYFE